jgi:hypothetical protein
MCADQRALGHGGGELVVGIEVRVVGEVRVDIDHAGEQGGVPEVDDGIAGLRLHLRGGLNRDDAIAGDDQRLRVQQAAGVDIHQMRGAHQRARGGRRSLREADGGEGKDRERQQPQRAMGHAQPPEKVTQCSKRSGGSRREAFFPVGVDRPVNDLRRLTASGKMLYCAPFLNISSA